MFTMYYHVLPCITMSYHFYLGIFITMYYHVLPCITMYIYTLTMYYHLLPCITMHYHLYLGIFTTMYYHALPCITMYIHTITMYYHLLPGVFRCFAVLPMFCDIPPCPAQLKKCDLWPGEVPRTTPSEMHSWTPHDIQKQPVRLKIVVFSTRRVNI